MDVDTLHPNPIPDPHHRKIELQSPQDLIYLQTNLIASARQKLDLHFPPSAAQNTQKKPQPATFISLDGVRPPQQDAGASPQSHQRGANSAEVEDEDEDPLRSTIRSTVDAYITRLYTFASNSITVNGLDATSLPPTTLSTKHPAPTPLSQNTADSSATEAEKREEVEGVDFTYEAHDTALQAELTRKYEELERLTVQVGSLRRSAPGQGAQALNAVLMDEMEREDAQYEEDTKVLGEQGASDENVLGLKALPEEWYEDRKMLYERGMSQLAALAGLDGGEVKGSSLTETVGRVQRARTVAMEFE